MSNKIVSIARQSNRLICVWVPTGNPRIPLTCVWFQEQHYPAGCIVPHSSIEQVPMQADERVQPCL
jgi:hypothetical protein